MPRSPRARALRQLNDWMADGTLAPGERIPGELVLAKRLQMARKTVRAALAELEVAGCIEHRGLAGRFIPAVVPAQGAIALLTDISYELDVAYASGALGAIDSNVLLGLDGLGQGLLLLRQRDFYDPVLSDVRLTALLAQPPQLLVIGAQGFRLGNGPLATLVSRLQAAGTHVAAFGDEAVFSACDRVVSDHVAGCRMLCEHLFAQGIRHIVRSWGPGSGRAWLDARDRGYEMAHAAAGLTPPPHVPVLPGADETQPLEVRSRLFAASLLGHLGSGAEPVGVLGISDSDVFPLMMAGRLLARDLRVCGYDHYWAERPEFRATGDRPVATIDKQNRILGQQLAALVAARLAGKLPVAPQLVVTEPTLVV